MPFKVKETFEDSLFDAIGLDMNQRIEDKPLSDEQGNTQPVLWGLEEGE